jgi:hypothetical protein
VLYSFLDLAFLVGHSALIAFNLFGWICPKTRRLHLLSILLTAASWLALAPWFGLGYCPCTDWHWQVKEALGETDLPNNYLTYLFDTWFGLGITDAIAERLAYLCLTPALIASITLNLRDRRKRLENSD